MEIETMKVKAMDPEQGDHVVINKADFDPAKHEVYVPPGAKKPKVDGKLAELKEEADRLGVGYASDITVDALASKIAEFHASKAKKPSDGLKVDELKAALAAKGIAIPEGARKADLAELLDAAE